VDFHAGGSFTPFFATNGLQTRANDAATTRAAPIGRADVLTTEQARRSGRAILARAVLGEDPQVRRQELRSIPSLGQFVAEKYLPFIKTYKRSWGHRRDGSAHPCPSLGKMALDEITAEHIIVLIARMRSNGYAVGTSNRVVMILRYMYNLAVKMETAGSDAQSDGRHRARPGDAPQPLSHARRSAAPRRRDHGR